MRRRRGPGGGRRARLLALARRPVTTFVALAACGLVLATVSVRAPERVAGFRATGLAVTSAPAELGASAATLTRDLVRGLALQRRALSELAEARGELAEARVRLLDHEELAHENERLRELLALRERVEESSVAARVLRVELAPDRVLTIDHGSEDGVEVDQSVVAPGGVVGKVIAVARSVAQVQCVTDPNAGLAVLVGSGRRAVHAIVKDAQGESMRLRYLDPLAAVRVGDAVLTSGLDQVHPKGLPVGEVIDVGRETGIDREIVVVPAVDVREVEEVLVLVGSRRAAERRDATLARLAATSLEAEASVMAEAER